MTAPTTTCCDEKPRSASHAYRLLDEHRDHIPLCPAYLAALRYATEGYSYDLK